MYHCDSPKSLSRGIPVSLLPRDALAHSLGTMNLGNKESLTHFEQMITIMNDLEKMNLALCERWMACRILVPEPLLGQAGGHGALP